MLLLSLRRAKTPYPGLENLTLVCLTVFITLLGLEFYLKVFFVQTDNFDTLARRNWRERYYTGTFNSLGYRDVEWTEALVAGKTKVMVVGDSFVEGAGIEQPQDRFPDQLVQKLGPDYVVFNLGRRGAYTSQEMYAALKYPYQPDILIWSYVVNDIEEVAAKLGFHRPSNPQAPFLLRPLVENSFVANFFYWRLIHALAAWQPDTSWQWFLSAYNDPEAWQLHQQELLSIYEAAHSRQIPLLVVVFPSMTNVEQSQVITKRIINLYQNKGVPTLEVADLIQGIPTAELIASPVDAHPSEQVHKLVAEALYEMLIGLELAK